MALPRAQGLYDPIHEHDACGVGFVAHIKGAKSHDIVQKGLQILLNLDHRGATGADTLFGDGAGILIQIPDDFYRAEMGRQGVVLPPPGEYGVGMLFLPKEHASRLACEQELERTIRAEGPSAATTVGPCSPTTSIAASTSAGCTTRARRTGWRSTRTC